MALRYAGIQCSVREVILSDKPAQMLSLSAKGTVPLLLLPDATVIDESMQIMCWALTQHDPDGWSQNSDAASLIERNDSTFKFHLDRYKYPERFGFDTDTVVFHRQQAGLFLAELDQRLSTQPYLCGRQASLADAALLPFVRQFAAIDPRWFAVTPFGHLQAWLNCWLESDLFASVMMRLPQWHAGDKEQYLY